MQEIYIVSLGKNDSLVKTELPLFLPTEWKESIKKNSSISLEEIGSNTPVLLVTKDSFFIGDLKSFTTEYLDASKKFKIPFLDGRPLLPPLLRAFKAFEILRYTNQRQTRPNHLIVLASNQIPAAILIQTINGVKKSIGFQHVVLGDAKF